MSDPATPDRGGIPKRRSRVLEYVGVTVVLTLVVLAAAFQEPLQAYFRLHQWDPDAPGRTVVAFLEAGKKRDQAAAQRMLGTDSYKPLTENGKWVGYFIVSQAGRMDIPFSDLAPNDTPKPISTEYVTVGTGAAEVKVPNATGQPVKYRLEMQQNAWKITEILGGHPAPAPA